MIKMKNKLLLLLLMVQGVLIRMGVAATLSPNTTTKSPNTTTVSPVVSLKGKMFTLSSRGGSISIFPPHYSAPSSTPSSSTSSSSTPSSSIPSYTSSKSTNSPWTTAAPYKESEREGAVGVTEESSCMYDGRRWRVRGAGLMLCIYWDGLGGSGDRDWDETVTIPFQPCRSPLRLTVASITTYSLNRLYDYNYLYLSPSVRFWSYMKPDFWNSVCITLDTQRNVAQMFKGANMSIRKVPPFQYVWSGEPVINFSGFDGQVTDVQVWDYPLRYGEVSNYMTYGVYGLYRGSVLSWSDASYSMTGITLLEDVYNPQPMARKERGRQLKGKKKSRRFFTEEDMDKQQF